MTPLPPPTAAPTDTLTRAAVVAWDVFKMCDHPCPGFPEYCGEVYAETADGAETIARLRWGIGHGERLCIERSADRLERGEGP